MKTGQNKTAGSGSEDLLESALFQLDDYVCVWNRAGEVVFANKKLEQLWRQRQEQPPQGDAPISPENLDLFRSRIKEVFDSGQTLTGEFTFLSGQEARHAQYKLNPLFDSRGDITHVIASAQDVTERKRLEQSQSESERQFRLLFNAIEQGCCLIEIVRDEDGGGVDFRHLKTNPAFERETGISAAEGRLISEVVPGLKERWSETWCRVAETGVPERHVNHSTLLDRWFDTTIYPLEGAGGSRLAFLFSDVTERKKEELAQRDAARRKDEFLATLAHELRNPLAPIRTAIEILRLAHGEPAAMDDSLEMMERQMQYLVRLVDDLMDISRISMGKVQLRRQKVDVRECIIKAMEASSALINADDRRVHVHYTANPLVVHGDAVRLVQILGNLLNNAGRHTAADGNIWIDAWPDGDRVNIAVRDDGEGMTQQTQAKVFDMFMQASPGRGGLGIGLALVRSLVELHGGTVSVHSAGLGKGSTFTVRLPRLEESPMETADAPAQDDGMAGRRILIVDDNRDAVHSLATLLGLLDAVVATANSGLAALKEFETFKPDVVLLDLSMPGMDGFEVARSIRAAPGGSEARLIAITGWGQKEDREKTASVGFDAHLVKPVDMQQLKAVIQGREQEGQGSD